ncbi:hypothetical protein [uncultured Muribaculum sp.]|uniref:hypothetical protein n=1 Tax=uncultured Muribaculum sp. TaxID=1918613 RepID=UPI00266EEDF4|nr:hypothetical protein [uncultured Muribaculum sp.]
MSGFLVKSSYEPIAVKTMEAAKNEVAKLPPGAVIVAAMKFVSGTAHELINWQKAEGYKFPVIAIVYNLNPSDLLELMRNGCAVDVIQRPAIDKQLVETVGKYAKPENMVVQLDNTLIPRKSAMFKDIEEAIKIIATTNEDAIISGECRTGKCWLHQESRFSDSLISCSSSSTRASYSGLGTYCDRHEFV